MGRGAAILRRTALSAVVAVSVSACGAAKFANHHRPPEPIDLTVYVDNSHVSVSPAQFGGGPVRMYVTNESSGSETLNILRSGGVVATSHAIDSGQTALVNADLAQGTYFASAGGHIATARINVAKSRPNADNALLQP